MTRTRRMAIRAFLARAASRLGRRIDPMVWVWVTVVAAVLFAGAALLIQERQRQFLGRVTAEESLLRNARIDLANGYLQMSLAGRPQYPFDREQGLALLDRAASSLEGARQLQRDFNAGRLARPGDEASRLVLRTFALELARFRVMLLDGRGDDASPARDAELRVAFHALERRASDVDAEVQQELAATLQRYDRYFARLLWVSGILLTVICSVVYVGGRARKHAEAALQASEAKHRLLFDSAADAIFIHAEDARVLAVNSAAVERLGYTHDELMGMRVRQVDAPGEGQHAAERIRHVMRHGQLSFETVHLRKDGTRVPTDVNARRIVWDGAPAIMSICRDISERRRAAQEQEKLKAQLDQAQRMEAVGRLAGGVAHDYNNMLSVILGFGELALAKIGPAGSAHDDLEEVLSAARRSSDMTRQLLAFARRQAIAPRVLDLNETVEAMLKMLRRLIGEDIDLAWLPRAGLWAISMDPSQVDQVLANLCVNARDAIADTGKVTIATDNVVLDEDDCASQAGLAPGEYVRLTVSDDGCGIDSEDLERVFEPYFTTKAPGEGTGLGLATVYGIVRQNDGFITLSSERGHGTTFNIYLPRHARGADDSCRRSAADVPPGRGETVLVVEDEVPILKLSRAMLEKLGYVVLTAGTAAEALRLVETRASGVQLLVTDVVMPDMNGRDLADRVRTLCPEIRCLFMSGYTADVIAHRGVLDEGVRFIPKPFSLKDLAVKVRATIDDE